VATASAEYPSGSTLPTSQPTFGQATLHAYKIGDVIPVSNELIADNATNFEQALAVSIGNSFATKEESWFLLGAGTTEPLGIFNWSDIKSATVTSGSVNSTGSALCDALIDLQEAVAPEYHAGGCYILSTPVVKALKKAKDNQGQYLWSNGDMQKGEPATFNGFPVYRSAALPLTVGAGIHGGFVNPMYITVGDRGGMVVERSRDAYFKEDATGFKFTQRVDVVVTNPNAIAKLTIN
jgi:HK97 family phage major capsid protein